MIDVNWLAVVACGFIYLVTGALWYSPMLFSKRWMKLTGVQMGKGKSLPPLLVISFVLSLVMATVLAMAIKMSGSVGATGGMELAFMMFVGFVAPVMGINMLYQGKSFDLFLIDGGFMLVDLLLMGAVLGLWK